MVFLSIATLMLTQVIFVFPHIKYSLFKFVLSLTCFASLATFVMASKSQPGYLKRINSEQNSLLSLLKKMEAERVCPTCELVQQSMAVHCTACNRCIVDFDFHSILVNNCISRNNRHFLISFLVSLMGFFSTLIVISLAHFQKPSNGIDEILDELIDQNGA